MALTRDFKTTVVARLRKDHRYRRELLREGVQSLLSGDLDTGKAILRDYVNATMGFEALSSLTDTPTKSLMRMWGPAGNPHARNLLLVIAQLQKAEGLRFQLKWIGHLGHLCAAVGKPEDSGPGTQDPPCHPLEVT